MRTKTSKTLSVLLALGALCGATLGRAQISVGPTGSAVNDFSTQPTVANGWSSTSFGTSAATFGTPGNLDNHVITNTTASAVNEALGSSATVNPPSAFRIARRNTANLYVQTRPTGVDYLLLMAKLRNDTGSNVVSVTVTYNYGVDPAATPDEEVPGHRVFYSESGLPDTWQLLPTLSGLTSAGALSVTIPVGNWGSTSNLHLLWADDNADGGTEGVFTIDNFRVTAVPATTPVITQHPAPQSVAPGSSVTLPVTAIGASPLTYYWRFNGNVIAVQSTPNYVVNNAALANQGTYSVIVSNSFGSVTSSNAFLTVACASAVTISGQPADQAVGSGGSFNLSVGASGTAPITYQWYRNDAPIANATNATYSKLNAQPSDSGLYRVVANNCFGVLASSSNAVVSITDPPITLIGMTNHFWRYNQSNTDLGAAWRAVDFNDSGWPQGRGIHAFEDQAAINPLTNTVLSLTNGSTVQNPAYYFRTTFLFTNDPALISLVATNYFDDGAIVYINGVEALRFNMPAGAVNHNTLALAANPQGEGTFMISNIPVSLLVQGTNTIAVEVHQNSLTSSDIAFGWSLAAVFLPSSQLTITNQPQNVTVEETKEIRLTLGLRGQPAYYQWYRNGVAVSNGTSNPLVIPIATTNDAGAYFVIATNSINSVTSSIANVVVIPDTNAPVLVEADGTLFMTNVLVSFSERITQTTATNINNYRITNTVGGAQLTIIRATVQDGTNVLLHTSARTAGQNYILVVNNLRDVSPSQNMIAANSSYPVRSLVSLSPMNGAWRYYDPYPAFPVYDNPNLGTAWKEFTYDEGTNAWGDGLSVFHNTADGGANVPGPANTFLSQTPAITAYFRRNFNLNASPSGLRLQLTHIVDDGAIFYLNGTELLRLNLPETGVNYQTPALQAVGTLSRVGPFSIPSTALRNGANVLAAELHQVAVANDKVFGAQLDASVQSFTVGPVVITGGPESLTVVEGSTVTFSVVQAGGATFRWQQNSNNIANATNSTYTITSVPLSMDGAYFRVAVSNATSGTISTNARLRVVADTNGPAIFAAYASPNSIIVTFTEPVTAATAQNTANYSVTNSAGASFVISGGATLSNGTNVTLGFASLPAGTYYVTVNGVKDTSVLGATIAPNSTVRAGYAAQVVNFNGSWRYDQSGVDRGAPSVWAAVNYNDNAWTGSGTGIFAAERNVAPNGAGGAYPAFPQPVGTGLRLSNSVNSAQLSSYYFRTYFNSYSSGAGTLTFRSIIDDGAVIYLNGQEVYRLGVANNVAPNYGTLANRTVGDAELEGPFTIPVTNVLSGSNVIAVSMHQVNLTSSDAVWGGEFSINVDPVVVSGTGGNCTPVVPASPTITFQRFGTNLVLSWPSSPVATNTCGQTGLFQLQRALNLSNAPGTTVWTPLTTVSPYTNAIPTNAVPLPNGSAFFRLRLQ